MAILTLSYGVSSSRKTTAMGEACKYLYEKTGKPIRAIYSDLGNWQVIRDLVDAGVIIPFSINGEPNMQKLLHKLATGHWPVALENGIAVDRWPVAPKSPIPLGDAKMRYSPAEAGAYLWEGLSTTGDLIMEYLRRYRIPIQGEVPSQFSIPDPDAGASASMNFACNSLSHFGFAQAEFISLLHEFASLPVERVLITAHEAASEEDDTREPVRGPALPGKKGTSKIGPNTGDCFHFETYNKPDPKSGLIITDCRVYFENHPDAKFPNISYKAKVRLKHELLEELKKTWPHGYFAPSEMYDFLKCYDELLTKGADSAREWKARIDAARKAA